MCCYALQFTWETYINYKLDCYIPPPSHHSSPATFDRNKSQRDTNISFRSHTNLTASLAVINVCTISIPLCWAHNNFLHTYGPTLHHNETDATIAMSSYPGHINSVRNISLLLTYSKPIIRHAVTCPHVMPASPLLILQGTNPRQCKGTRAGFIVLSRNIHHTEKQNKWMRNLIII
jgi:hypothetical protein